METTQELQRVLRERGTSLGDFAKRHGYKYRTVCIVAQRWWHRTDRTPHGGIARAVLAALRAEVAAGGGRKGAVKRGKGKAEELHLTKAGEQQ